MIAEHDVLHMLPKPPGSMEVTSEASPTWRPTTERTLNSHLLGHLSVLVSVVSMARVCSWSP